MSVKINIPQFLQHLADNVKVTDVDGRTVGECLGALVNRFPQFKALLFDKKGKLQKHLDVYINGKSAYPEELSMQVNDGDEIHIVNVIVGG